jgi:hypothetical protein
VVVAAGIWVALLIDAVRRASDIALGDFRTYWAGANHVLQGSDLYPTEQLIGPFVLGDATRGRGYVYPPSSALLSAPLALAPEAVAFAVFTIASAAILAAVVWLIARREGLGLARSALLTVAVAGSGPAISGLVTGNVNVLVAAMLGLMWLHPRASGYLAVVGGLVKVYPAIGIVWTIRKRAPLLGPIALGLAALALSVLTLGVQSWHDFGVTMTNGISTEVFLIESPRSVLTPLVGGAVATLVAVVLTGALIALTLRLRDDHRAFLCLGLAWIALAPDWQVHYFVVALVAAVPLLAGFSRQRPESALAAAYGRGDATERVGAG